jgi:glycerophosphoryl diester phosphodiesterase
MAAVQAADEYAPARLRVVNYAHRGASGYAPENTLAAFGLAAELGAQAVELDVRRTLDGALVVLHDATLERTTDAAARFPDRAPWAVGSFTLAEVRTLDAGSWFDARFAGERVPTLAEAMDVLADRGLGLLLEAKAPDQYPGMAGQIGHQLRAAYPQWLRAAAAGRLTVESFDWEFVRELRTILPRVSVGLLGAPEPAALPAFAGFVDQINPHHTAVTADYVEQVHQLGMAVNAWTVDDPAEQAAAVAAGVDGVITNRPDVLGRQLSAVVPATR